MTHEWQPISTAPKTGDDYNAVELLGFVPDDGLCDAPDEYHSVRVIWWEPRLKGGAWWCDADFQVKPSHWMPLPAAPKL